jgi:hypothetical protein
MSTINLKQAELKKRVVFDLEAPLPRHPKEQFWKEGWEHIPQDVIKSYRGFIHRFRDLKLSYWKSIYGPGFGTGMVGIDLLSFALGNIITRMDAIVDGWEKSNDEYRRKGEVEEVGEKVVSILQSSDLSCKEMQEVRRYVEDELLG